jgi:hypothetical protein
LSALKRITKISIVLVLTVPLLVGAALVAFWPDPSERHFSFPLPATAKLLHYERSTAGFEVKYAFVFEVSDDKLLTQFVKEWSLAPAGTSAVEPISFVALRPPLWWLSQQQLQSLPERYGWVDQPNQRYRSVWIDRVAGKLFAEYGQW